MPSRLTADSYGKSRVRLSKIVRHADRHDLIELTVETRLEGDFARSYTHGDNTSVIATDSQRNTVYVLAKEHDFTCGDEFAHTLARHFFDTYDQVAAAEVRVQQSRLQRITLDDKPHPHAFLGGGSEVRTARCRIDGNAPACCGGISGLVLIKTAGSAFVDFVDDRFRTLPDTTERIFATTVDATWRFTDVPGPAATTAYDAIRAAWLKVFAENHSLAVQQTLREMGDAALEVCDAIDRVDLSLPNQHRVPFSLSAFGHDNAAEIFVTTDEPAGQIRGTVERS
jgi:urate oxidase